MEDPRLSAQKARLQKQADKMKKEDAIRIENVMEHMGPVSSSSSHHSMVVDVMEPNFDPVIEPKNELVNENKRSYFAVAEGQPKDEVSEDDVWDKITDKKLRKMLSFLLRYFL